MQRGQETAIVRRIRVPASHNAELGRKLNCYKLAILYIKPFRAARAFKDPYLLTKSLKFGEWK